MESIKCDSNIISIENLNFNSEEKLVSTSTLNRFFNSNSIYLTNNILISEKSKVNRPVFMWKQDLHYQLKFIEFGDYINNNVKHLNNIMIFDYKYSLKGNFKSIYSFTISLNSNTSTIFFKHISILEKLFNFNIFSNSIGYGCITINFKNKNSAVRFKKLLELLNNKKYLNLTIFECMNECRINLI